MLPLSVHVSLLAISLLVLKTNQISTLALTVLLPAVSILTTSTNPDLNAVLMYLFSLNLKEYV